MSAPSFPEPSTFGLNLTDLKSEDWKCDKIYLHHWCLRVGLQLWTQTVQNLNSWQTYWKPGDWQQGWYLTLLKIAIWLSKNCQKLDFFFQMAIFRRVRSIYSFMSDMFLLCHQEIRSQLENCLSDGTPLLVTDCELQALMRDRRFTDIIANCVNFINGKSRFKVIVS